MQTYLVGGAVRDRLLGRPVQDRDWVVVGATPEQMLELGYTQVGADFPVFLHPQSKEEYALARTERKQGKGYAGFVFDTDAAVTLEQDLQRRDLTINAIAEHSDRTVIDPFGGVADLHRRVLRHVSPAFVEDPVRLLRIARFLARYAPYGFTIAAETLELLRALVESGEVAHLVPERVFEELRKALSEPKPSAFLRSLRRCGALAVVFPELDALYGVPQRVLFHPEVDAGVHQQMVSDLAASLSPGDAQLGFVALMHDLGKALTPSDVLPRHLEHEQRGLAPVQALCARLKVPREWQALAEAVCRDHLKVHQLKELRAATICDLLSGWDAWRKPERVRVIALSCRADKGGRLGMSDAYPQAALLVACHAAGLSVKAEPFVAAGLAGPAIGAAVRIARIDAIRSVLSEQV